MKKNHVRGLVMIEIVLLLFTALAFALPLNRNGGFWIAYGFGAVSVVMQGYALYAGFVKGMETRSKLYGFPIARIGTIYMAVQLIASIVFMVFAAVIPVWIVVAVCVLALAAASVGILSAEAMREEIEEQDIVLKKNVKTMRSLQSRVRTLVGQCEEKQAAAAVEAFSEELQYSDPVSAAALVDIENELTALAEDLQKAVVDGDWESTRVLCRKATVVLRERNRLCKLNKEPLYEKREAAHQGNADAQKEAKKYRKAAFLTVPPVCLLIALMILLTTVIAPGRKYEEAVALMAEKKYTEAIAAFTAMEGFKDSDRKIEECHEAMKQEQYDAALLKVQSGDNQGAYDLFASLGDYLDSKEQCANLDKAIRYQEAMAAYDAGDYGKAHSLFEALGNYQDAPQMMEKCGRYDYGVGDSIVFGTYEQDQLMTNGKEPIEWIVLDRKDNQILLLSRQIIDIHAYHQEAAAVTWEHCSLRKWLNGEFLNQAFTAQEQTMIQTTELLNPDHPVHDTEGGYNTIDKVFLLGMDEAGQYLKNERADVTTYVTEKAPEDITDWWLRSPGSTGEHATVMPNGDCMVTEIAGIRPAIWIDLDQK